MTRNAGSAKTKAGRPSRKLSFFGGADTKRTENVDRPTTAGAFVAGADMLVRRPGHPPKTTDLSSGCQRPGISPSAPHGATKAGLPGSSFGGFRLQKLLMHLGHDGEGEAKPEHVGGGDDADANPRPPHIGAPDEPCWQGLRALEDYKRLYYRSHAHMHAML